MVQVPRNVVVIGAGTMGSGIAAHLANLGLQVSLLDLTDESVRSAFDKARKARPPHFYVPETSETIRLGSIKENLDWIREADWVCEAIIEKPAAKKALFEQIEPLLRDDAYITTNTSGLEISLLGEGRSPLFRSKFLGTHFFNPPRYLKLLELIPTPETDPQVMASITEFLENHCARRVVLAKDTPGFIANRYGMWCMYLATQCAEKLGLTIEQVDAITGTFMGRPKSGSFRLNDLVGLDIMQDIAQNLMARCPHDPRIDVLSNTNSMNFLLEKGWIGEKAGQGYYRREGREFWSLDLQGFGYRMRQEPELPTIANNMKKPLAERLSIGLEARDEVGEFMRSYLLASLKYAESLKEEISHSVEDFDKVMKWGFGWEAGPFEIADMINLNPEPYYKEGKMRTFSGAYSAVKAEPQYATVTDFPIIDKKDNFNVRDMGEGVTLVSTTTKMGVFTVPLVQELSEYLNDGKIQRLVLTSEGRAFSAGFDLSFLLQCATDHQFDVLEEELARLQNLGKQLSSIPSVAAVFGFCLGGGFEMATSCSIVAALAETQIGLPEAKVGLIPGGGGAAHMRRRNQSNAKSLAEAARHLILGYVSPNADEARKFGYLRRQDVTIYHPDRLLTDAKALALEAKVDTDLSWAEVGGPVNGMIEQVYLDLLKSGDITEYDHSIGEHIRHVFVKAKSFDEGLQKERAAFHVLLAQGLTVARIKHMMESGKPLRN